MTVQYSRKTSDYKGIAYVPLSMAPAGSLVNPGDAQSKDSHELVAVYQTFHKDTWVPEPRNDGAMDLSPPVTPPMCTGPESAQLDATLRAMRMSCIAA